MTDRRTTISLIWRPTGAPARRYDDFDEVPAEAAPIQQKSACQVERRAIGRRLENWGQWANARGIVEASSNAAAIYENARRAGLVDQNRLSQTYAQHIDVADAERINTALTEIDARHLGVLQGTYVSCLKPWAVAGACGFLTREYGVRLGDAQAAMEAAVGGVGEIR